MILSQPELRAEVEKGEIRFDPPLEERQWHEASVDLRLGFKFAKLTAKKGLKVSLGACPSIERILLAKDERVGFHLPHEQDIPRLED
jgi:deoxycytidine triphosphate deaminase